MAEQNLVNSSDSSSTLHIIKESIPIETRHVNSLIRRSLSNKLHVPAVTQPPTITTVTASSSTTSLAMYCIETNPVAQSTRRQQSVTDTIVPMTATPTDEVRMFSDDVEKCAPLTDGDNDSFDDEDEAIITESCYTSLSSAASKCVLMPCPICLDSAVLQSSPCCTFHCCESCWCAHISATMNDGRVKVPCISNECNKYLTRESIVSFIRVDSVLYDRYIKLYTNFNQNPRAKTCPRCSHLYSLDTIKSVVKKNNKKIPKQVQCSECSLVWCFRCSAPWHENLTCKQFLKGDKLLLKWINQKNEDQWNARKCPKCSSFIQRAGGCPHMTCSSCACDFCYLCGRRYVKIPVIGQHNYKFSVFGCPYILHPEKPWLRRTIRGAIATGLVVASPVIVAGAVTAAVTVLPSFGIYKLVKHVRSRRHRQAVHGFLDTEQDLFHHHHDLFQFDLPGGEFNNDDALRFLRRFVLPDEENINETFPLSIFADMDVENLFSDDDKPPSDFRTCPTTPALNLRKGRSRSLENLSPSNHVPLNRHHSITIEQ